MPRGLPGTPLGIEARDEGEHSVLTQAEIMLFFGHPNGAMKTLARHEHDRFSGRVAE